MAFNAAKYIKKIINYLKFYLRLVIKIIFDVYFMF